MARRIPIINEENTDIYKVIDQMFIKCYGIPELCDSIRHLNEKANKIGKHLYIDEVTTDADGVINASLIIVSA